MTRPTAPWSLRPLVAACAVALAIAAPSDAATVWSGPSITFTKADFADPTDPANQDLILPGVAITRGASRGPFNAALESVYASTSPADTEWAWAIHNPGQGISAANHAALLFEPWRDAHGGDPLATVGLPGVLHLVSADVYLDFTMLSWTAGGAGGGFSWVRSTPEPASAALVALGLAGLAFGTRRERPRISSR